MNIGDKVHFGEYRNCTVTRVFKNGNLDIECWVQGGFMQQPELWKMRVKSSKVIAA